MDIACCHPSLINYDSCYLALQAERHVATIRLDESNTVERLRDKLADVLALGYHDSGFPIVRPERHGSGYRMVGYIGVNELEHALCASFSAFCRVCG